jgi:hypothetical protein
MFKEKQIIEKHPFTKSELVALRKGGQFKEGSDWVKLPDQDNRPGAVCWTMKGMVALLASKGIVDGIGQPSEESKEQPKVHRGLNDEAPAIVKQKFPNTRIVRCEIRGQPQMVSVRDSTALRVGSIIPAKLRGDKWHSLFKVDSAGRVHA